MLFPSCHFLPLLKNSNFFFIVVFEHGLKGYPEVTFMATSQLKAYSNHYSYRPYPAIDFYIELPTDFNREFFPQIDGRI